MTIAPTMSFKLISFKHLFQSICPHLIVGIHLSLTRVTFTVIPPMMIERHAFPFVYLI